METLDAIASRYGVLPSVLIGETNPWKAISLNLWAHNYGVQREGLDAHLHHVARLLRVR